MMNPSRGKSNQPSESPRPDSSDAMFYKKYIKIYVLWLRFFQEYGHLLKEVIVTSYFDSEKEKSIKVSNYSLISIYSMSKLYKIVNYYLK